MRKTIVLVVCIVLMHTMFGQETTHWQPVNNMQNNAIVSAVLFVNGEEQHLSNVEIGAFCGEECRAAMLPYETEGQQVYFLTIMGNANDLITFRLWDHETDSELEYECQQTYSFVVDDILGDYPDWYQIHFTAQTATWTYELPITGYGTSSGGYYLIAPPFDNINPAEVEGMTPTEEEGGYDLYYFDQSQDLEWINYKGDNGNFKLQSGKGYLYARENGTTLTFTTTEPYNGNGEVELVYSSEAVDFPGWNLIGNPWGQTAYLADGRNFYVMNDEGTEIITAKSNAISAMQGVFVVTKNTEGETVTFTTTEPAGSKSQLVLDVTKDRGTLVDRAIVRFDSEAMLGKMMLNPASTKVYVPMDGGDYAVVGCNAQGRTPVSFAANQNGCYTISVDVEDLNLEYLHLVDNLTGMDIDLLQTPSYSFETTLGDYASRFELVYRNATCIAESGAPFAYFNGKAWVINSEEQAELEILDLTGRLVSSMSVDGQTVINLDEPAGVYVMRLANGSDVKVQKLIVR